MTGTTPGLKRDIDRDSGDSRDKRDGGAGLESHASRPRRDLQQQPFGDQLIG